MSSNTTQSKEEPTNQESNSEENNTNNKDQDNNKQKIESNNNDDKNKEKENNDSTSVTDVEDDVKNLNIKQRTPKHRGLDPRLQGQKIEVLQNDPSSPLYSAKTFEELKLQDVLLKGIYEMGFKKPSHIQEISLPMILGESPKNVIGQAQAGTGKTACFVLGMLSRIDTSKNYPQALCICHARELALQIYDVVEEMGKFTEAKLLLGVKNFRVRKKDKLHQHIVIGTPGKVNEMVKKGVLDLKRIEMFVIDEADVMLDSSGLVQDTQLITRGLRPECQRLLFSATFKERVKTFAKKVVPHANVIAVKKENLVMFSIKQYRIECQTEDRLQILSDLYGCLDVGQSIIYVERRTTAEKVSQEMEDLGFSVSKLIGSMETADRDRTMQLFRDNRTKVLVTTNVLARGIDVPLVALVINYDMPFDFKGGHSEPDPETYVHRIGRASRFGREGVAISLIHDQESRTCLEAVEKKYSLTVEPLKADLDSLQKALKVLEDGE
eukprot:gb/GECH01013255.1/.p1 GENE.gb/GECH01013255.1/~~gb/GECH01013255.1/.p1  ORF type:complete len:495 (+),score=129.85 gb/GECH01013255.1/:1-1485(+)